mmetsp:Transcript_27728/g.51616  ORF Transcript_27728/g.51616 Transcript_27728/m.51616 type:complete len:234 (-) Transcript_27728:186-887(-)
MPLDIDFQRIHTGDAQGCQNIGQRADGHGAGLVFDNVHDGHVVAVDLKAGHTFAIPHSRMHDIQGIKSAGLGVIAQPFDHRRVRVHRHDPRAGAGQGLGIEPHIRPDIHGYLAGAKRLAQKIDLGFVVAGMQQQTVFDQVVRPFDAKGTAHAVYIQRMAQGRDQIGHHVSQLASVKKRAPRESDQHFLERGRGVRAKRCLKEAVRCSGLRSRHCARVTFNDHNVPPGLSFVQA